MSVVGHSRFFTHVTVMDQRSVLQDHFLQIISHRSQLHMQDLHFIVHNLLLWYTHLQLWLVDSRVWLTSFSAPWHVGSFPPTREGICIPCIARGPPGQSLISSFFERLLNGGILQALASGLYFFWEERLASPQGSFMELHRFQSTVS